ncbi:hypothetical protein TB2_033104 [Malus domestica]
MADEMIEYEELSAGRKDGFVEFVKEEVGKKERCMQEEEEFHRRKVEGMSEEVECTLENTRLYKLYPLQTPGAPQFMKSQQTNKYFKNAHEVL